VVTEDSVLSCDHVVIGPRTIVMSRILSAVASVQAAIAVKVA